jgi:uncharacterized protein YkwD
MRFLVVVLLAAGCGNLQPDSPGSKLNSDPGNSSTVNNSSSGNNNVAPLNNVDSDAWGTGGPADTTGKSPDGSALCALSDVKTDDLGGSNVSDVPADPWGSGVQADATARCGDDDETLAWRLLNCERIAASKSPMRCDQRLVWMGREHTLDMIRWDYFRHNNLEGEAPQDRADRHGVAWSAFAENIAPSMTVLQHHYEWMDSAGHRGNILGNYTHVGFGSEPDGSGLISTTVFLTPR